LIVGAGDLGQRVARVLQDHSRWGFSLIGYLDDDVAKQGEILELAPVLGSLDDLQGVIEARSIEEVWIALPTRAHERLAVLVNDLEAMPVRVKIVPDYFSLAMIQAKPEILGGIPLVGLREPVIEGVPRLIKRSFDLVVSTVSLVVAAPVMALIALGIRIDSPGPVLFRQKRVGENGRLFEMLKFRTMVVDAEARRTQVMVEGPEGQVIHKQRRDPRVTRVGSLIRRLSLDELPQLVNVLKGEMSLVGPRPELPWLVDMYKPWQRKRFAVPQGITGWWQVNGRSDKPMHLNTDDDLYYVYNYSLWLDIVILLRTPIAVLQGKGAF
jgi:exopolysaccharide biosynthesis polyprenyl glycosylphosphotransferase